MSALRKFAADRSGAAAILFAFCLIPVLTMIGAALDYARAARAQTQLRAAVDAASIAAAKKIGSSYEARQQAAEGVLQANLAGASIDTVTVTITDTTSADGPGVQIEAAGEVPTAVMGIVGRPTMAIAARAEVVAAPVNQAEIALVLDNTGSMVNDMPALKAAATSFVNRVFSGTGGGVKMSVVPYVAAVNVGPNFPPAALELTGTSGAQGAIFRAAWLSSMNGCSLIPWVASPSVTPTPSGPPPPDPPPLGSPGGKDKTGFLHDGSPETKFAARGLLHSAGAGARALFGISRAAAAVTANSVDPIQFFPFTPSPPSYPAGLPTVQMPVGYYLYGCSLAYNGPVSNLELFNRLPGATWKGCVEARPSPYDVTDDPPDPANIQTLFAPYFAPDEPDSVAPNKYRNDYLSDMHASWVSNGGAPPGWTSMHFIQNLFKYDGVNVPTIVETPPNTKGPNANCPDQLLKLTNDKASILNRIATLNYWAGGGTFNSEGLAWGWRTISPNAPFASGAAYGTTKKYIVLMSDGLNSLVENRPQSSPYILSDYTAYGWLWDTTRWGYRSFPHAETMLNTKMQEVCVNAKAKGISVFTILFRETDPTTVALMRQCASSPDQALLAGDTTALGAAFDNVASQVSTLRLRK